ncbi:MAG TPA: hypothetical protein VF001_08155, partial [Candidatus Limnocylindria bacterium]
PAAVAAGPRWRLLAALALIALLAVGGIAMASRARAPLAASSPTPRATVAGFAVSPVATTAPATPAPTLAPTAASAATGAPATAGSVAVPVSAADPATAVVSFYRLVTARQYAEAARLWSPRMQANYPPASNIDQRFAATRSISADSAVVISQGLNTATVSVYLTEVTSSGTRHWSGTWSIVRSGSGWQMDSPQLGPA